MVRARVLVADARDLGGVEAVEEDVRQQVGLVGAARRRQPAQQLDAGAAALALEAPRARDVAGDLAQVGRRADHVLADDAVGRAAHRR